MFIRLATQQIAPNHNTYLKLKNIVCICMKHAYTYFATWLVVYNKLSFPLSTDIYF